MPATQLDAIQKYAGAEREGAEAEQAGHARTGTRPRPGCRTAVQADRTGSGEALCGAPGKEWLCRTARIRSGSGNSRKLFPYEETEDQLAAIEATKKDMESTKIMDRLICGDVGYGKTEIAIRAAFKAVQDGKQVVYLVPTTILAQQHYNTFVQRMKDFPVRVDLLCRFRTPAETEKDHRRI